MKKEIGMWLVVAVLAFALIFSTQKAETMAIEFNGSNQYVTFPSSVLTNNLTSVSVSVWVYIDTTSEAPDNILIKSGSWLLSQYSSKVAITNYTDGTVGLWSSPNSSLPINGWHNIIFTFIRNNNSNDPVIYIDGDSVAVTEVQTPSGSIIDDSAYPTITISEATASLDGKISGLRIYNRILTADEIATIYSARGADNIRNGLVFCPFLKGAKGLQAFDGATLGAGNTIVDPCSGAYGTPSGDPVGVGETYLVR